MESILQTIFYIFSFLAMYVQVFFFVTYLERKKDIVRRTDKIDLDEYKEVTIVVPCYNEEKTIAGTIDSLLDLDYPKDKLKIIIVDDGSRDRTWEVIQSFAEYSNIKVFKKENGGKHTALNFALERLETEFVGCLDADSFVDTYALSRIMTYFANDQHTMAVAPSIIVSNPKNILQKAQKAEYDMAIYNKKMLGFLGGIHVTPGPFSIFRKKVFDDLGPYRKAHNTEDQEIALRMQEYGYKIDHCPDAYVYTNSPNTIPKLYRQRIRWIYGFIRNAFDYRRILFRKKYGNVAIFTIPSGIISVSSVIFLFVFFVYNIVHVIQKLLIRFDAIGAPNIHIKNFTSTSFDFFFLSTKTAIFTSFVLYGMVILGLLLGRRMADGKGRISFDIVYFFVVYSVIAPFWLLKAIWNAVQSKESSWTLERAVSSKKG